MKRALILAALLATTGCSLAPKDVRPEPPVPTSWPVGDAYLRESEAALPALTWQDVFRDPRLQQLIGDALAGNRDLRVAAAQVEAGRAQVRVRQAAQFPALGVDASLSLDESGNDGYAVRGGISSFEIDLFGRLANATAAERDRALATEEGARAVRIGLVADLAQAWADYAADRDLLVIARNTADAARETVRLTRARLEVGIAPRTDLRRAEQVLATAEGDLATQTTLVAQDENRMRLLLGGPVNPTLLAKGLDDIGGGISALPAGTSSEVLLRRPDVIGAEYRLRAAGADLGAARADLFPRISLTSVLGFASTALSGLFDNGNFSFNGAGGVSVPIFDGGRRRATVRADEALQKAALATYERTIQSAFREVADALAVRGRIADRLKAAASGTFAAADTARLVEARYRGGLDSSLANLDAQRSLYAARRAEVAVKLADLRNRIALYRTLGGDSVSQAPQAR